MYFKYLSAAFGSALISSIYGIVDMAMVGQYQGPSGTAAMAVVSPIWNIIYSLGLLMGISTFVQCCACSIGQASQPIISVNFGANQGGRVREVLKYAVGTALAFGLIWTGAALAVPNLFVRIFMTPTDSILKIAPAIIRSYGLSFLLLPLNIFSTYYFQALMKPTASFVVSVVRGAVISGILILVLPAVTTPSSIWFAMPITELIVAVYVAARMVRYTRRLPGAGTA